MLDKLFSRNGAAPAAESPNPISIGKLAVERGYITADDLTEALQVQRERTKLGQILVGLGKLSEEQLECLLLEQRIRKGETVSVDEMRRHERKKLRRRIGAVTGVFKGMGDEARDLASSVTESMNGRLEKAGG